MKRATAVFLVLILFLSHLMVPALAESEQSLEVTVTGFTILYMAYMEALGQHADVRREWVTENQTMLYLNDCCLCLLETDRQSDFANIKEALHTASPESQAQMLPARCSMVATIKALDPDLEIETITDLVMNVLPRDGKYASSDCLYTYNQTANVYMLHIKPNRY